jgi:spore germination protein KA
MLNKNRNKKTAPDAPEDTPLQHLKCSLDSNISAFKTIFKNDDTIIFREISNISSKGFHACLMLLDGMASTDIINKSVIDPIMKADMKGAENGSDIPCLLISKIIPSSQITVTATVEDILLSLFSGDAALLIDGCCDALLIGCKEMRERALEEPGLEKALRGPKEGFTETMMTNLLLLRRRLKTPDLKLKYKELGVRTKTKICICYIENLAREDILTELESRLDRINTDGIIDANSIEELIKDSPLSPFKTIGNTERPDVAVAKLLEGRIAVIVDGTPSVLTLPFVFMEYFQTADDYYINYWMSSFNRLLRCLSEFFTTSIPAIYVALTTYHQEMIPTPLLLSITASRQDIPFPTIIEALILLFLFEVIREAGADGPVGQHCRRFDPGRSGDRSAAVQRADGRCRCRDRHYKSHYNQTQGCGYYTEAAVVAAVSLSWTLRLYFRGDRGVYLPFQHALLRGSLHARIRLGVCHRPEGCVYPRALVVYENEAQADFPR